MKRAAMWVAVVLAVMLAIVPGAAAAPVGSPPAAGGGTVGINVLLTGAPTSTMLAELGQYGTVQEVVSDVHAVQMTASSDALGRIRHLRFVSKVNTDQVRVAGPIAQVQVQDFSQGLNTWDLDAINVAQEGTIGRTVAFDGHGVYIAVLDTGLIKDWRDYLPESRIATQYAKSFGGGGNNGHVSEQPHKWERDKNGHGTHVTSTILGYNFRGVPIDGVAPDATVIPVKVLNQNGSGWSSVVARGITYVADLKAGPLHDSPVIISMSLGGPGPDALEQAAIDYAISQGVIVVAAAGNGGTAGMDFPGAYAPVISAAASGWTGEWQTGVRWWLLDDVADPTNPSDFYIADFSSRGLAGQDLDVAAPGSWVVGPFQVKGTVGYYFLGGTSMATPHVSGTVALMAQKDPSLTPAQAESILEGTAVPLPAGCRNVLAGPGGPSIPICWGADATGSGLLDAAGALSATP